MWFFLDASKLMSRGLFVIITGLLLYPVITESEFKLKLYSSTLGREMGPDAAFGYYFWSQCGYFTVLILFKHILLDTFVSWVLLLYFLEIIFFEITKNSYQKMTGIIMQIRWPLTMLSTYRNMNIVWPNIRKIWFLW